ncbi:inorganic pyrophosphatase 1 [Phyllostomus discolor]|uniref:Inorganic pyrophosphatase 1 n=1 Tax=Phyllostomus discolor TaxID=89673 RepID=A0A834AH95_9CHIR|nr:inorganic pyrophosphatase 1 [Phyllostomus discolor]
MSGFSSEERAAPFTSEYRVFFKNEKGQYISPFHDIPIYADKVRYCHLLNSVSLLRSVSSTYGFS